MAAARWWSRTAGELLSFRGAPLGASPESITTIVSMDSGPAPCVARPGMTNGEALAGPSDHAAFGRDVVGIVRAVHETADRQRLQHFRISLALSGGHQNMARQLGLDRGCALGFWKRRRGVLHDSFHQLDEIG